MLGQALDPDRYDYSGAVLWNNRAPELWHMFTVYLGRNLAEMLGIRRSKLSKVLRVEYSKVAEYQARGVVHFHAVIRLDGPEGPSAHPPIVVDTDTLCEAITSAASAVRIIMPAAQGAPQRVLHWGTQLNLRPVAMDAEWTDQKVARYIAKYATKGAETARTVNRPLRSIKHLHRVRGLSVQARNMIEACWRLGRLDELAWLRLRQWAHMLGYGGHFSTKSRRYSTTLGAMRTDRAEYRAREAWEAAGVPPLPNVAIARVGSWQSPARATSLLPMRSGPNRSVPNVVTHRSDDPKMERPDRRFVTYRTGNPHSIPAHTRTGWFRVSSPWSSRADTARTRRHYIRPALAPAPLRERAGRLAHDTGLWLCSGCAREREARIVRSRLPASSPLRVPIRPAPPRIAR